MSLGDFDQSGRRKLVKEPGAKLLLSADLVVEAIGQVPDIDRVLDGTSVCTTDKGTVDACTRTLMTQEKGVFAGGDCISGPATVIEAVAQGRKAAASIDCYLGGDGLLWGDGDTVERKFHREIIEAPTPRNRSEKAPLSECVKSFTEVELTFEDKVALKEATRCLRCDVKTLEDKENAQLTNS